MDDALGRYYDRDGNLIATLEEWATLFEDPRYKVVIRHVVGDVLISTVWLGLDHSFGHAPRPLIFETMVFGGREDGFQDRYPTEEWARVGHLETVDRVARRRFRKPRPARDVTEEFVAQGENLGTVWGH